MSILRLSPVILVAAVACGDNETGPLQTAAPGVVFATIGNKDVSRDSTPMLKKPRHGISPVSDCPPLTSSPPTAACADTAITKGTSFLSLLRGGTEEGSGECRIECSDDGVM
jgi:hypothetical protein